MIPTIATTYAVWPKGIRLHIVRSHIKVEAVQRQFKKIARIYCGLHKCRVYTEDLHGTILYDTDRGDWVPPEVGRSELLDFILYNKKVLNIKDYFEQIEKNKGRKYLEQYLVGVLKIKEELL
jgi:hypothetical protein